MYCQPYPRGAIRDSGPSTSSATLRARSPPSLHPARPRLLLPGQTLETKTAKLGTPTHRDCHWRARLGTRCLQQRRKALRLHALIEVCALSRKSQRSPCRGQSHDADHHQQLQPQLKPRSRAMNPAPQPRRAPATHAAYAGGHQRTTSTIICPATDVRVLALATALAIGTKDITSTSPFDARVEILLVRPSQGIVGQFFQIRLPIGRQWAAGGLEHQRLQNPCSAVG